jgi:hypothetical protein
MDKIVNAIKKKIAEFIVNRSVKGRKINYQSFAQFYRKSFNILVFMPEDEAEFNHCFQVLKFLEQTKKNAFIFTHDFRVSLIPLKYRPHVIEYNVGDTNRLNLASRKLTDKLMKQQYHAVIDLNIKDNIFYSHLISILDLQLKIGFKKNNSDNYYNIQVDKVDSNPEKSYKNLVNCLQMF